MNVVRLALNFGEFSGLHVVGWNRLESSESFKMSFGLSFRVSLR